MEIQLAGGSGQQAELRDQISEVRGNLISDLCDGRLESFSDLNDVNYGQLTTDYGLL